MICGYFFMNRILFLAISYDWMRPYTHAILRALWGDGCKLIAVLEDAAEKSDFDYLPQDSIDFFVRPKGWLAGKKFGLNPSGVIARIHDIIEDNKVDGIVSVTMDLPLSFFLPRIAKKFPTVYFVHNVEPHKLSTSGVRKRIFHKYWYVAPTRRLVRSNVPKITHARWQCERLKELSPKVFAEFIDFPSLVDDAVREGKKVPPEIENLGDYLLFFGKIEPYKGVEGLINCYLNSPKLHKYRLVIAGKGELSSSIPPEFSDKIIRINRYIPDAEVGSLFIRARVVVYPYVKATQSGVVSLSTFFGRPTVVSDTPFFRELAEGNSGIYVVDINDSEMMANIILKAAEENCDTSVFYVKHYESEGWAQRLRDAVNRALTQGS